MQAALPRAVMYGNVLCLVQSTTPSTQQKYSAQSQKESCKTYHPETGQSVLGCWCQQTHGHGTMRSLKHLSDHHAKHTCPFTEPRYTSTVSTATVKPETRGLLVGCLFVCLLLKKKCPCWHFADKWGQTNIGHTTKGWSKEARGSHAPPTVRRDDEPTPPRGYLQLRPDGRPRLTHRERETTWLARM